MSYEVNGIQYDYDSSINQEIKRKFVQRDVYCCVTSMAEYILSKSWEDGDAPFGYDDITNFYMPKCSECRSNYGFEETDTKAYKCENCGHIVEDKDELDTEPQDIFEWWMVDSLFAEKLEEKGEPVLLDEGIWGRTCSGQAILLDWVISQICYDMEILEGQKYEWKR